MNILLFGDVVGKPGRIALQKIIPEIRKEHSVDLIVANVENMAHGFGITPETIEELREYGVDVFTGGNHLWKNSKGVEMLSQEPADIVRPANTVESLPGRAFFQTTIGGTPIMIMNLLGEVFMKDEVHSPFETFDRLYEQHGKEAVVIVDFHAEATGEKRALSWYTEGRASIVVGTHTHVPTADQHIMPAGTAYVSDLGFCGATDSSLGMDKSLVLKKVAEKMDVSLAPPDDPTAVIASGILVQIDEKTQRATAIERIDQTIAV